MYIFTKHRVHEKRGQRQTITKDDQMRETLPDNDNGPISQMQQGKRTGLVIKYKDSLAPWPIDL